MDIEIIHTELEIDVFGFSGVAINNDFAGTAFSLMNKMWQEVKSNNLQHKGQNIWVYESEKRVFAGVELNEESSLSTGLERKQIRLLKYAYYKHIGPYHLIKHVGQRMNDELKSRGYQTVLPYIEIYGHWTEDEAKLETEMFMSLK